MWSDLVGIYFGIFSEKHENMIELKNYQVSNIIICQKNTSCVKYNGEFRFNSVFVIGLGIFFQHLVYFRFDYI